MNTKLISASKKITVWLFFCAVLIMLSLPTHAFSETYGEMEYAESKQVLLMSEPVDVTLIKNGTEYDYQYFPVKCSEFLAFAGVTLTEVDKVSVAGEVILYDNMMIDVSTIEYEHETVEELLEYGYERIEVDTIPKGEMRVISEGINGIKKVSYLLKKVDGVVVEREVIGEEVVVPAVKGKAEYGVGGSVTASDGTVYNYSYKRYMEATAYTYVPGLTTMTTATGATLAKGIVAVDPREIPMHTKMYIASDTFEYGYGVAEDTGGAIKGNIIDLAFMSYDECIRFGRRNMWVYFLEE